MAARQINVIIAEDHSRVRKAVRNLLETAAEIRVVGEACNGEEAVDLVGTLSPDVLILDLEMPIMDGMEAMDFLRRQGCQIPILILSASNSHCHALALLACGAHGYILKDEASEFLVGAVRRAAQGKVVGASPGVIKKRSQ